MIVITIVLFIAFAIFLPLFFVTKNAIFETITITVGIALYHFVMRLAVGVTVNLIMQNKANYKSVWFKQKGFENKLYKFLNVRKWKKFLPTFDPKTFDANNKTIKEIVEATCQAEIVHEIIIAFSFLPIFLIPFLGGKVAIIITSILSATFDGLFVILQRYNRPKLVKVMERFKTLKNGESKN